MAASESDYITFTPSEYIASSEPASIQMTKESFGTNQMNAVMLAVSAHGPNTIVAKIAMSENKPNASSTITYMPPTTPSIGSGLTAAGGSASITSTVTNKKQNY